MLSSQRLNRGINVVHLRNQFGVGVNVRIGSVQALDVRQNHQQIGIDQICDQGRKRELNQ